MRLLKQAEVVVYAGSLVNPAVLTYAPRAACYDSAGMTLEEIVELMVREASAGKMVVRLHSGDPTLYGALQEQILALEKRGVDYEIVPGVSSFTAAAAALGAELTQPGVSQTVILTRLPGRTPVPAREELEALANHRASLCLFLSASRLETAAEALHRGYGQEVPAALVYRASWPQQRVLSGELEEVVAGARAAGLDRSALLLVGPFLRRQGGRSLLYHPGFTHGYRRRSNVRNSGSGLD
jgi:precorrin-4/cobalt-precorrin-4 C11-methyltransferase